MKRLTFVMLACLVLPAYSNPFRIAPLNIFNNDGQTRSAASLNDQRWAVRLNGCTGSMLSPKYVLTARHCNPRAGQSYTSGGCLELGCTGDLQAVRVVESYANFDAAIVEVRWARTDSLWRQRYAPRVQTHPTDLSLGRDGSASELFTVGFPVDKNQRPMYATGFAKERRGVMLRYNIGTINGNSGGAVWKLDDYTLVSQTNHGPHQFNQPGWNGNNPENSNAWNGGPQIDLVYAQSAVMKSVFPTGTNPNVSFEGYLVYHDVVPPLDP